MPAPPTAYLDPAGRPLLRRSVTGFLDVLGFSNLSTTASSTEEAQQVLEKVAAAINDSRAFVRSVLEKEEEADSSHWALKFFSDNLAVGFPVGGEGEAADRTVRFALRCVQRYELRMALSGFFVRGALSVGDLCLTDEIIFGPALVECYLLESKASIVPRVIVGDPLIDSVARAVRTDDRAPPGALDWVCRDVDGRWFVNYLQAACGETGVDWDQVARHKAAVLASLVTTTRHDVLPKFGWACRYHNVFCHWHRDDPGFSPAYRIDRSDEQSTITRLSDLPDGAP